MVMVNLDKIFKIDERMQAVTNINNLNNTADPLN